MPLLPPPLAAPLVAYLRDLPLPPFLKTQPTTTSILVALVMAAAATLWLVRRLRPKYDLDKIPGPWKHAYPIVGNILEALTPDFHRKILEWSDQYGGVYRLKMLWWDALVVTDPFALAQICGRGEGALEKAADQYKPINYMCDPHGASNLLTSRSDDNWKSVRKAIAVSFSFQNIKKKWPAVISKCDELVARIRALGPRASVDMDQAALRVTLDVIGLAGFGHDFDSVKQDVPPTDHLLRVLPRCFTEVMLRIANPLRGVAPWAFKKGMKGQRSYADFQREMKVLLREMRQRYDSVPPADDDTDIAAQLWRVSRDTGLKDDRILSEIGILFVEGFETTGHTTSWTLFNIATVPGVQERIAEELDSLGLLDKPGHPGRQMELDDLKSLRYLTAAAKEAMRMYPVVAINGRVTERPTRIAGYLVPAGVLVSPCLFSLQNTVHNWEEPLEFRPERWADVPMEAWVVNSAKHAGTAAGSAAGAAAGAAAASLSRDSGSTTSGAAEGLAKVSVSSATGSAVANVGSAKGIAFMPFSEGPRNCVGQSLAKMEVIALLAKLLSAFHIELAPEMGGREGVRRRESTALTLQTVGTRGIRMHLHPRNPEVAPQPADAVSAAAAEAAAVLAAKLQGRHRQASLT